MGALELGQPAKCERFAVRGMTCGSCVRHVEAAFTGVPGVWLAEVSLSAGTATVVRDSSLASLEALQRAVAEAGYELDALGTTASESRLAGALPLGPVVFGLLGALA